MENDDRETCPECNGKKVVQGSCVCNMEWRGTMNEQGEMTDCQCVSEVECPACGGTGYILRRK